MTNAPEPRANHQSADEPQLDDHPDAGMQDFERTGGEEADLAEVDEDESPRPEEPGPDRAAAPVTSPPEDSR